MLASARTSGTTLLGSPVRVTAPDPPVQALVGGPEKLVIDDIPTPTPAVGEVRVKLKCAALNRRDYWITVGAYPRINFPAAAGSDGAGVVDALGGGVDPSLMDQEVVIYPALQWGPGRGLILGLT